MSDGIWKPTPAELASASPDLSATIAQLRAELERMAESRKSEHIAAEEWLAKCAIERTAREAAEKALDTHLKAQVKELAEAEAAHQKTREELESVVAIAVAAVEQRYQKKLATAHDEALEKAARAAERCLWAVNAAFTIRALKGRGA